jgi:hypothetical protein
MDRELVSRVITSAVGVVVQPTQQFEGHKNPRVEP